MSFIPHSGQNVIPAFTKAPHPGHTGGVFFSALHGAPHFVQKSALSVSGAPHFEHLLPLTVGRDTERRGVNATSSDGVSDIVCSSTTSESSIASKSGSSVIVPSSEAAEAFGCAAFIDGVSSEVCMSGVFAGEKAMSVCFLRAAIFSAVNLLISAAAFAAISSSPSSGFSCGAVLTVVFSERRGGSVFDIGKDCVMSSIGVSKNPSLTVSAVGCGFFSVCPEACEGYVFIAGDSAGASTVPLCMLFFCSSVCADVEGAASDDFVVSSAVFAAVSSPLFFTGVPHMMQKFEPGRM